MLIQDPIEVYKEAKSRGIFWNHHWIAQSPGGTFPSTMHIELIKNDLIHGVEVVNDTTYSDEALQHY